MNATEKAKGKLDEASKEIKEAVDNLRREVAELSNKVKEKLKGSGAGPIHSDNPDCRARHDGRCSNACGGNEKSRRRTFTRFPASSSPNLP